MAKYRSVQDKLFDAIFIQDIQSVKFCVENGAEINVKGSHVKTFPLHSAVSSGNLAIVKILLQNGANVNIQNRTGKSPLCLAATGNRLDLVKLLVQNGAQIDLKDNHNQTPLDLALRNSHDTIAYYLKNPNMTELEEMTKIAEEKARKRTEKMAKKEAMKETYGKAKEKEETNAKKKAEANARQNAEKKAEKVARKKAEKNAKKKAEEESRKKAEENAKQNAKKKAEEEATKKAEENAKQNAKKKAEKKTAHLSSDDIMARDYYSILGVKKGTQITEELKLEMNRAYKRLALEHHPDSNKDIQQLKLQLSKACLETEEKFKKIRKAYEVLCDPQKKQVYDQMGEEGVNRRNWN